MGKLGLTGDALMAIRHFLDKTPLIGDSTYVDPTATVIGDVIIGEDCSLWPNVVIRGDVNYIRIGNRTNIQDNSVFHVNHDATFNPGGDPLIIGDDVTIGHRVLLHGCTIQDTCLIGMGSIVMDKVIIESQVMLGAGSLVPRGKVLKQGYLYVGNPVQQVRLLTEDELNFLSYSAKHYVKLKNQYS